MASTLSERSVNVACPSLNPSKSSNKKVQKKRPLPPPCAQAPQRSAEEIAAEKSLLQKAHQLAGRKPVVKTDIDANLIAWMDEQKKLHNLKGSRSDFLRGACETLWCVTAAGTCNKPSHRTDTSLLLQGCTRVDDASASPSAEGCGRCARTARPAQGRGAHLRGMMSMLK